MSEATIKQTVEELFTASWASTPIAWENVEARDPTDPDAAFLSEGTDPFIEVHVAVSETLTIEIPHECIRYYGEIMVDIHVPEGSGSRQVANYFDSLNNLLQYKTLSNGVRVKQFIRIGDSYRIINGWVTYSAQWPFEAEFS